MKEIKATVNTSFNETMDEVKSFCRGVFGVIKSYTAETTPFSCLARKGDVIFYPFYKSTVGDSDVRYAEVSIIVRKINNSSTLVIYQNDEQYLQVIMPDVFYTKYTVVVESFIEGLKPITD